jgi:hypothetical protein
MRETPYKAPQIPTAFRTSLFFRSTSLGPGSAFLVSPGRAAKRPRGTWGVYVTGGPGGLACLARDLAPGAGAQWGNLGIAHVGARADRGDAGRRVSAEEATERLSRIASERQLQPEARRKALQELRPAMPSA